MDRRLNLVTLGVADVAVARAFYERLGFRASSASQPEACFMQLGPMVLSLFGRAALAADAKVADTPPGFGGITLAQNQPNRAAVDAVMAEAAAAGAHITKPAQDVFWGGYAGYFADADGHLWEIAWNPFFPLDSSGSVQLPE